MSYGVEAAPKKALPPTVARTGSSPGCVVATLIFCAGGGALFVTTVLGGALAFAIYASSEAEEARRSDARGRLEELQARLEQDQERMRERLETERVEPHRFEPIPMPAFPELVEPSFPATFPRHEFPRHDLPRGPRFGPRSMEPPGYAPIEIEHRFSPSIFERPASDRSWPRPHGFSASPVAPSGEASRLPLIVRPASVTYSRSMSRPSRLRSGVADETAGPTPDPFEQRLERLQAFSQDPEAFAGEAVWFAQRRRSLSDAILASVEKTIAEFVARGDTPEAVRALPKILSWYGTSNLAALAKLLLREVEQDGRDSSAPRRQILVGTFQRYRTLDPDWRNPAAGDALRALAGSTAVASHVAPSLEALNPPYAAPVEDFLIEFSFDSASESMYAQRKALLHRPTRERLLDEAVARLESADDAEREAAYVILAAAESTPERADAVLEAICRAFANDSVEPSPAAHAALACWIDGEHAASFRDFCDCECPVRRFAARAAVARFPIEAEALAAND